MKTKTLQLRTQTSKKFNSSLFLRPLFPQNLLCLYLATLVVLPVSDVLAMMDNKKQPFSIPPHANSNQMPATTSWAPLENYLCAVKTQAEHISNSPKALNNYLVASKLSRLSTDVFSRSHVASTKLSARSN